MDRWKWVNFVKLLYFDFAYNSRIKQLNQLSQAYDSNAKSNALLALLLTSYLKK